MRTHYRQPIATHQADGVGLQSYPSVGQTGRVRRFAAQCMNYPDGQEIRVGDRVRMGDDSDGVVVCSIDRDEYTTHHPKAQWTYLEAGVMIHFPKFGLIHFVESDEDLELVSRAMRESDAD